jgi:hypothetical protein
MECLQDNGLKSVQVPFVWFTFSVLVINRIRNHAGDRHAKDTIHE